MKFSAAMARRIEMWPLGRLRAYARNAKTHGAGQIAKLAASMAEFGWTAPMLVSENGELIAGHGRILAAEKLGLSEASAIVLDPPRHPASRPGDLWILGEHRLLCGDSTSAGDRRGCGLVLLARLAPSGDGGGERLLSGRRYLRTP